MEGIKIFINTQEIIYFPFPICSSWTWQVETWEPLSEASHFHWNILTSAIYVWYSVHTI